jgi:hypothetical protein
MSGILLGLAPFVAFALLSRFVALSVSLWAAAAVSAMLVLRGKLQGRSVKILEAGTFVLFLLLGLYASMRSSAWDIPTVRSFIDSGLLLIILVSLLLRRPFTLQYAREEVAEALQTSPGFIRTNYVITAVWAAAMAVVVIADLAMHFVRGLPIAVEIVAAIVAISGALWFSKWYPHRSHAAS